MPDARTAEGASDATEKGVVMSRQMRTPGPDHPITLTPDPDRLVVRAGGVVIAETADALTLKEGGYPAVSYIPLADVDPERLRPSDSETYCPYKGEAGYYALALPDGTVVPDAVWTYREPYPAVAAIAGRVAFYPEHVTVERVSA